MCSCVRLSNPDEVERTSETFQHPHYEHYGLPIATDELVFNSTLLWTSAPSDFVLSPSYSVAFPTPSFIPYSDVHINEPDQFANLTRFNNLAKKEMQHDPAACLCPTEMSEDVSTSNKRRSSVIQQIGQVLPLPTVVDSGDVIIHPSTQSTSTCSTILGHKLNENDAMTSDFVVENTPASTVDPCFSVGPEKHATARYYCRFCQKPYHWLSHWQAHERIHTGERPFKCDLCGKAFTRSDGLKCHKQTHAKKKRSLSSLTENSQSVESISVKNKYCGDTPTSTDVLDMSGSKNVQNYRLCERRRLSSTGIQGHIDTEKFRCDWCDKTFSKKSALEIHTRVHTGVKPYRCTTCIKAFSTYGNLKRHLLTHENERQ